MGVAGAGDVFAAGAEFYGHCEFGDDCAGVGAYDVRAEDFIGGGVGEDFDEAFGFIHCAGAAVGGEGEFADLVLDVGFFEFFFAFADGCGFGPCVDDAGDGVVIDVAGLACHDFGADYAFVFGFVGQHWAGDDVADGVDAGDVGLEVIVDCHAFAFIEFDANCFQPQTFGIRAAAYGDEDDLGLQFFCATTCGLFYDQRYLRTLNDGGGDFGRQLEFHALFIEGFLHDFRDFAIHRRQDAVDEFDDCDLRAEALPDRAEFEADDAAADHHHCFGNGRQGESTGRCHDALFIDCDAGERHAFGAGGDEDVFGGVALRARSAFDGDFADGGDFAPALKPVYFVFAEEIFDARRVGFYDGIFVAHHCRQVEADAGDADAVRGQTVHRVGVFFGTDEQGFGRDAADIEAGATQGRAKFDAGGFHAQLRGANGGDIAAGAGTDNDEVILRVSHGKNLEGDGLR